VNEAAYGQLGYTREEFSALTISEYETIKKPEETARRLQKILREGRDDFETLYRTKSSEIRNVHVSAKALHLDDRVLAYSIFQDITESKQAEQKYRNIMLTAVDGFWTVDAWGHLRVDLIMPKKTGRDASEEILKIRPDIKVIFQSGFDPDMVQQKSLLKRDVPVVIKPVPMVALLKKIRSVLDDQP
jgi:PAS domain S-box-containing protein